jgi:hypothetical protein
MELIRAAWWVFKPSLSILRGCPGSRSTRDGGLVVVATAVLLGAAGAVVGDQAVCGHGLGPIFNT